MSKDDRTGLAWLDNRSAIPFFVSSPTFDRPDSPGFTVVKVRPGHSVAFFDYAKSRADEALRDPDGVPFDPHSVHVSFYKGWGEHYKRQEVLECPCWLRITMAREEGNGGGGAR